MNEGPGPKKARLVSSNEMIAACNRQEAVALRSWARRLREAAKRESWDAVEGVVRELCDVALELSPPEGEEP